MTTEGLQLRRDLICQKLEMSPRAMWVLKDPLSKELHYASEDEFTILQLLDGKRSLKEILAACSQRFASHYVASETLIHFLADAKRRRLLVVKANSTQAPVKSLIAPDTGLRRAKVLSQLLAWRLPGVRINHLLDVLLAKLSPWLNIYALSASLIIVTMAATIAVVYLPTILRDVTEAFLARESETLIQFFVVVAIAKGIHELAHALTCRYFGGDCRELGIMILMGMPCLYCDVSDAWLMPQRYKRILVSSAGMIIEVGLASVATILWFFAADPVLSQWCLVVMTVCSLSTVLVNGNPLMRYDGYFILSDLVGIPNLGSKSSRALRQVILSLRGRAMSTSESFDVARPPRWLPLYAIASLIYRSFVFLSLAWMVYQFTAGHRVAALGLMIGLMLVAATMLPEWLSTFLPDRRQFVSQHPERGLNAMRGLWIAALLMILLIPLPRTLVVSMQIHPADSQPIFASMAGILRPQVHEGVPVEKGDLIATIDHHACAITLVKAEGDLALISTTRRNLQSVREARPEVTASLEAAIKAENAARERLTLVKAESERSVIHAPIAGFVFAECIARPEPESKSDLTQYHGTYLDSFNDGIAVQPGEQVCTLGSATGREAVLYVEQKQASLVRRGQHVELILQGAPGHTYSGAVIEVSSTPVDTDSLLHDGHVASSLNAVSTDGMYQVRVALADSGSPLPVRTTGQARIHVEPLSIALRLVRLFSQSIRI